MGWGRKSKTRDVERKKAKGGASLQLFGAATGGTLSRVSDVVRLRGLHGPFLWGTADGDLDSEQGMGRKKVNGTGAQLFLGGTPVAGGGGGTKKFA